MENKREELIEWIKKLTPEQAKALLDNWGILLHVMEMDTNEGIFTKTFLDRLFGEVSA